MKYRVDKYDSQYYGDYESRQMEANTNKTSLAPELILVAPHQ